ncbi:MAG: hypothetical protein C4B58_07150 [Deltaproteobacteria bacterium]|nr:MAG: hypothetical protein C4B58_07150 [Deltaproteobacteria bacterium]
MDSRQLKEGIILSTLCAVFFFLWGGFLIVNPVMAATITVCPGTTCNATTIQGGIDMASSGDWVVVSPGIYNENIYMRSGVNVKSAGDNSTSTYMTVGDHTITAMNRAQNTIIQGNGSIGVVGIPDTVTTDVTLDGFTIENVTGAGQFVVRIMCGAPTITNNIIRNGSGGSGGFGGIGLQGFGGKVSAIIDNNLIHTVNGPGIGNGPNSNATIENNEIWDCNGGEGVGIGLWGHAHPSISNNTVFDNNKAGIGSYENGLQAEGGSLDIPAIRGNTIHDNLEAGIRLTRADSDTGNITVAIGESVTGNTIYGNKAGIRLADLTNGTIQNNSIHDHTLTGIWLHGVTTAVIDNNRISHQNMAGIRLEGINDITISDNNITSSFNKAGIAFDPNNQSAVVQAIVDHNEIQHNGQAGIYNRGATTLTVRNNNLIHHNTWGGIFIDCPGSTNTIEGNTIEHNSRAGIGVNATTSVTITDNGINDNLWGGISINDAGSDSIINGDNAIHGNNLGGIRIKAASSVTVEGNIIDNNGYGGIYDMGAAILSVNGTDIHHNQYGGIEINHDGGTGTITHNTIHDNVYGGIGIKSACTFEISDNEIHDNLRGGIHTGDQTADGGGYTGVPALLTIKRNKVYDNGGSGYGGGIDVRHASGTICNNLVYDNHRSGIRFGDNINEIVNNTVVSNGTNATRPGAGIVYDDLAGDVNAEPGGYATNDIPIKNNICTNNVKAGIRVNVGPSGVCPANRDYNLLCQNHGITDATCPQPPPYYCEYRQLYMCPSNTHEIFDDPLFVNPTTAPYDFHLWGGSPALGTGEFEVDMGAYGGSDPITW